MNAALGISIVVCTRYRGLYILLITSPISMYIMCVIHIQRFEPHQWYRRFTHFFIIIICMMTDTYGFSDACVVSICFIIV